MKKHTKMSCECLTANQMETQKAKCYCYTPLRMAQAFVPIQVYTKIYALEEGWYKGTIFPELYSPY